MTEALEIGKRSGVPVHIEHYRTRPENAGQLSRLMGPIDKAKADGVDCTLELYPYPTGSGSYFDLIPAEYHEGGPDALMERLNDKAEFDEISSAIDARLTGRIDASGQRIDVYTGEEHVFTHVGSEAGDRYEGMSWSDVARQRDMSVGAMLCHLLIEKDLNVGRRGAPPHNVAAWNQVSRDCVELLSRPDYMVGSDSIPAHRFPHPRAYGTFPRLLGRLRRQFQTLGLEEMVQRMTENPALRFGLTKRGRLAEGYYADIVVFDAETIIDTATYEDPKQFPLGIPFVLVNGQIAVDNGRCTGVMAGQAVP